MATKKQAKAKSGDVVVTKGNHLTVTTYPDGRTELEWDDDALLKEVREALASVGPIPDAPKRRAPAKKAAAKTKTKATTKQ